MPRTKRSHSKSQAMVTIAAGASILAGALAGAAPAMAKPGDVVNPLAPKSYRYTGEFGPRCTPAINAGGIHKGQDLTAPDGKPIRSIAKGVISKTKNPTGGGAGYIIVKHTIDGKPIFTGYFHMWKADQFVKTGQVVKKGQKIGLVGNSGPSANAHLHFEVWKNAWYSGTAVNPTAWMKTQGVDLKANASAVRSSTKPASCTYYATGKTALKSSASNAASTKKTVNRGAVLKTKPTTTNHSGQYIRVTAGGVTGWAHQSTVSPNKIAAAPITKKAKAVAKSAKTTNNVHLRKAASSKTKSLGVMKKGIAVIKIGQSSTGWAKVKYGNKTGWIPANYIKLSSSSKAVKTTHNVHLRKAASSKTKSLGVMKKGFSLIKIGQSSTGWAKVKYGSRTGWIPRTYIK